MTLRLDDDDEEAEQKRREDAEARAAREIHRAFNEAQSRVFPPDFGEGDVNASKVAEEARDAITKSGRARDALERALLESAALGVDVAIDQFSNLGGFSFDWTLAHAEAREWAGRYTDDLLNQLGTTTQRLVGSAVTRWIDNGEGLPALRRDLEPVFGKRRANLIAATEVTRAYAEGSKIAYQKSGVVSKLEWYTVRDERVCPYCGSMHGKTVGIDHGEFWNELPDDLKVKIKHFALPPAHPGCRCFILPVIMEVDFKEPEPKQEESTAPTPVVVTTTGSSGWKPVMTPEEADAWSVGTAAPGTYVHTTSTQAAESIRTDGFKIKEGQTGYYGAGVYLTKDKGDPFYGKTELETRVFVTNPYRHMPEPGEDTAVYLGRIAKSPIGKEVQDEIESNPGIPKAEAVTRVLTRKGYDSVITVEEGNEIINVFDPKKVVVVDRKAKPAATVEEAVEAPKSTIITVTEERRREVQAWVDQSINEYLVERQRRGGSTITVDEAKSLATNYVQSILDTGIPSIEITSSNFLKVLDEGRFKTQFETKKSKGLFDPDSRATSELNGIGLPIDLDPSLRPIYGYLRTSNPEQSSGISQYGDLTVQLKTETLSKSTFTVGDSLAPFSMGVQAASTVTSPGIEAWDGLIGRLVRVAKGEASPVIIEYIELQFQNQVTVSDIQSVIDSKKKLTKKVQKQLRSLGIDVLDGDGNVVN